MARLIVEAVRNEELLKEGTAGTVKVAFLVSVSDATTGRPVSQLKAEEFRLVAPLTLPTGWKWTWTVTELTSAPSGSPSGIYRLNVTAMPSSSNLIGWMFEGGVNYAFGIGVVRPSDPNLRAEDFGQTVVSVMGYGHEVIVRT